MSSTWASSAPKADFPPTNAGASLAFSSKGYIPRPKRLNHIDRSRPRRQYGYSTNGPCAAVWGSIFGQSSRQQVLFRTFPVGPGYVHTSHTSRHILMTSSVHTCRGSLGR